MTISLKKVSAGSGYDYLTRQVVAQDSTVKTGLAAYYEEKGESPGVWMGSGLDGLDGINAGDPVTEAQMKALFGDGLHPLADQIRQDALAAGLSERDAEKACRLGRPFAVRAGGSREFQQELKRRYAAVNVAAGRRPTAKLDAAILAQIRTEVAGEFFAKEFGRSPTPLSSCTVPSRSGRVPTRSPSPASTSPSPRRRRSPPSGRSPRSPTARSWSSCT